MKRSLPPHNPLCFVTRHGNCDNGSRTSFPPKQPTRLFMGYITKAHTDWIHCLYGFVLDNLGSLRIRPPSYGQRSRIGIFAPPPC